MLTTLSSPILSLLTYSVKMFLFSKVPLLKSLHGCLKIFLCSIVLKLNSYLMVLSKQLSKIQNPSVSITPTFTLLPVSSRNLGVLFESNLSLSDHISSIIKSCIFHVRNLRRLRLSLDQTTVRNTVFHVNFLCNNTNKLHDLNLLQLISSLQSEQ
jgi:hypothetical protein